MRTRFRTLLLAGAASLAMSGAYAAVTDGYGVQALIGQVVKIVWNGNDISAANPLPTMVTSGTVTANQGAPAAQSQANAWPVYAYQGTSPWAISGPVNASQAGTWTVGQGTPGASAWKVDGSGVTQPVSAAALPLPAGAATSANQSSEIAALGAPGDAAYSGSGTASIVAALKGLYSLTAATPRVSAFADASQVSVAANGTAGNIGHDPGGNGPYTRYNATFYSSQSGTVQILGSDDTVNFYPMTNQAYTAATVVTYTVPITFRYYYAKLINGGTAATGVTIKSSFTAN